MDQPARLAGTTCITPLISKNTSDERDLDALTFGSH
jgi:hypothetical protein